MKPHEISPELVLVDPELAVIARLHLPEPGSCGRPSGTAALARNRSLVHTEQRREAKRSRVARQPLLLLTAASLALNAVFIGQSFVERPSLASAGSFSEPVPFGLPALDGSVAALTPGSPMKASVSQQSRVDLSGRAYRKHLPRSRVLGRRIVLAPRPLVDRQNAASTKPRTHQAASQKHRHAVRARVPGKRAAAPRPARRPKAAVKVGTRQTIRWSEVPGATYYNLVLWREGRRVLDLWPTSARARLPKSASARRSENLPPGRYLWFVYPGFGGKASHHYGSLVRSGELVIEQKGEG